MRSLSFLRFVFQIKITGDKAGHEPTPHIYMFKVLLIFNLIISVYESVRNTSGGNADNTGILIVPIRIIIYIYIW